MRIKRIVTSVTAGALYCGAFIVASCGGDGETVTNTVEVCPSSMTECGGACVDTTSNPANCGACDNACATGEYCAAGTCTATSGGCPTPLTDCSGACVDTDNDPAHCGGCDSPCSTGEHCSGGTCAGADCPLPLMDCSGTCTDTNADGEHCGGCTTACDPGEKCNGSGVCDLTCQTGFIDCGGTCINPDTNNAFCGASGDCLNTNAGVACVDGEKCDGSGVCALTCQTDLIDCNGTCIDPDTDNTFCGATTDCTGSNDGTVCVDGEKCDGSGVCALTCQSGLIECASTCIDPATNPTYCGATGDCLGGNIGTTCTGGEACVAGACSPLGSATSCLALHVNGGAATGVNQIDPDGPGGNAAFNVYCDNTTDGGGWTLIARFSNADADNWMLDSGLWWYDQVTELGAPQDRAANADMISQAFWTVAANEIKITRTDNADDGHLIKTVDTCLGNQTFRGYVTSFGDFRNGTVWASQSVASTCPATLGNNWATTSGFGFAMCSSQIGAPESVSFWTDAGSGDGAVMMIGGGGDYQNACGASAERADHGIGVTEANAASFADTGAGEGDFGNDTSATADPGYALNLFVR